MVTLFYYLLYNTFFISHSKVYQALYVRHRPTGCDTSVIFFFFLNFRAYILIPCIRKVLPCHQLENTFLMDVILFLQFKDSYSSSLKIDLWVKNLNLILLSKCLSTLLTQHAQSFNCLFISPLRGMVHHDKCSVKGYLLGVKLLYNSLLHPFTCLGTGAGGGIKVILKKCIRLYG